MHLNDFTPESLRGNVVALASEGATDFQIAGCLGIHPNTLWKWKAANKAGIADAIREGRMIALGKVENALFRRATGYVAEDSRQIVVKRITRRGEEPVETRTTHYRREIPPHFPSIIAFLNRVAVSGIFAPADEDDDTEGYVVTDENPDDGVELRDIPETSQIEKYYELKDRLETLPDEEVGEFVERETGSAFPPSAPHGKSRVGERLPPGE